MINLQKFVDDTLKELFPEDNNKTNRVYDLVKSETKGVIRQSVDKFVLAAFGLKHSWSDWEIRDTEKFVETRIGKYVFGDVQDAIIKELHKINPDAVARKIEKAVPKEINDLVMQRIHDACSTYVDEEMNKKINEIVTNLVKKKLDKMIDASVKVQAKKPKTQSRPKQAPLFQKTTGKKKAGS